jgi:hypothetical protein
MSASGGNGGTDAVALPALSSDVPKSCVSATESLRFLQSDQKAAVGCGSANRAVTPRRKADAAFEPALRELKTMDKGRAQLVREHASSGNHEIVSVDSRFDPVRVDTWQGDEHEDFAFGFEDIDRGLPSW